MINKCLLSQRSTEFMKEIFVKELKVIEDDSSQPANEHSQSQKSITFSKTKKTKKTKAKKNEEDSNIKKIYYAMFNADVKLEKYEDLFREIMQQKNNPTAHKARLKQSQMMDEDSLQRSKAPPKLAVDGDNLSKFQEILSIHLTHFQYLVRKILFEKFQKMRIWCRQAYSQDNQNIFLLLKIQGRLTRQQIADSLFRDGLYEPARNRASGPSISGAN